MLFFQLEKPRKKRDVLSEKRESGMALKQRELTPESGNVDTYAVTSARRADPMSSSGIVNARIKRQYAR